MIAVFGGGVMGETFIAGLLRAGHSPQRIVVCERLPDRAADLAARYGIRALDAVRAAEEAATLLIATKPQDLPGLLGEVGPAVEPGTLVVSLAAGITTATLEAGFPPRTPCFRAMPNTPAVVDEGMTVVSAGSTTSPDQLAYVVALLESVGRVAVVPEDLQDAVTAISGSGPAYVFALVEHLVDAGVALGLSRDDAVLLVTQTVLGAATMARQPGADAAELRERVTSPGGTTRAALDVLGEGDLAGLILRATRAARDRSRELGGGTPVA